MSYHNSDVEDLILQEEKSPDHANKQIYYNTSKLVKENPVNHSSEIYANSGIEMQFPQNYENSEIFGRSMKKLRTVKESSKGIEDILLEMPSRTLGRKSGRNVAKATSSSGPDSLFGTYSRFGQNHFLTHVDGNTISHAAHQLYDEIAEAHGEVPMNEVRSLPVNMMVKKRIRNFVHSDLDEKKAKAVNGFRMWRYNTAIKYERFVDGIRALIRSPRLWNRHLKQVEGDFGSGVSSYFLFLRGLFFLSIPSFILSFAFISLPQLIQPTPRTNPDVIFTGEEFLTGANWLSETIMYYGYYTNGTIESIPNVEYQMPLAYLLATAGYFVLCLLWLSRATATIFRDNYIEGKVRFSNFVGKTFCAWDYGITSTDAAELHQKIVTSDLKEVLAERLRKSKPRSSEFDCKLFIIRVLVWLAYFLIVGGSAALVYYLNKSLLSEIYKPFEGVPVLQDIMLAVLVSAINLVMPIIINLATLVERYKNPRRQLYIAISRNYLLKVSLLGVICAFWTDDNLQPVTPRNDTCWETRLGEEVYRLVIMDFLFSIIFGTFCAEFLRKIFSIYWCKAWHRAEFSIVNNVMDLIYGQTLCWIGVFFSPLLPLIVIIKYFLMFYIKKISVMQNCRPSKKRWRAAQSRTMFNVLLLVSFLLSALFFSVIVFRKVPSADCGPYRGLNRTYDAVVNVFETLRGDDDSEWFVFIVNVISNIWFLSFINTVLLVFIVMRRSRAQGYAKLGKALREQIALEGRDKVLLLQWLQQLSNHSFSPKPGSSGKPNHRVPILLQHHASSASSPAQQRHPASPSHSVAETLMKGNVLTHVDPQHMNASNIMQPVNGTPVMKRRRHRDPVLNRAIANQEKQRPASMFMLGESDLEDISRAKRNRFSEQIELEVLDPSYSDTESVVSSSVADTEHRTNAVSAFKGKVYS